MKWYILLLNLFLFSLKLNAQQTEILRSIDRTGSVVLHDIDNTKDPMAFMTNTHRHKVPKGFTKTKNVIPNTDTLVLRTFSSVPVPSLVSTLSTGPDHDGGYPYDNGIAVSNQGQVVTVTNLGLYVYSLSDTLAYSSGFQSLLGTTGDKFDPQIAYDSENDRFIAIILRTGGGATAGVDIAVTATSDPTGTWYSYFIPNTYPDNSSWVDFPHMGISSERLYVHANIFINSDFEESNIWDIPLTELYSGGPINPVKHVTDDSNIRFLSGANEIYGPKFYGVNIALSNMIRIYTFENGNMSNYDSISTTVREASGEFTTYGKLLYPGGDASNSYCYIKDSILYYAHSGTYYYTDKLDTSTLIYGSVVLDTSNLSQSRANSPNFIIDSARNFCYAQMAYAGYTDESGRAASILTALYGGPQEYLGTISYHIAPNEEISAPLVVARGQAEVDTRFGDYIQSVNNPAGTREVWISSQFGAASPTGAIENTGNADGLFLGNIIAKVTVDEYTENTDTITNTEPIPKLINSSKVYPNPAYNFVSFEFELEKAGIYLAKLYSMEGSMKALIAKRRLRQGNVKLSFNANAYSPGMYLVTLESEEGIIVTSHRLIIK